jgi:hypothetical protein
VKAVTLKFWGTYWAKVHQYKAYAVTNAYFWTCVDHANLQIAYTINSLSWVSRYMISVLYVFVSWP